MGSALRSVVALAAIIAVLAAPAAAAGLHAHFQHMRIDELVAPSDALTVPQPLELQEIASLEFQQAASAWVHGKLVVAMKLFLRSAQKGHEVGECCYRLGQYEELPPADIYQALRWYARGARMNHKPCTTRLGILHIGGGERAQAKQLLIRTATPEGAGHGDSLAQWFLAELELSAGMLRSAVRWWKRSAESGGIDAMMRLFQISTQGGLGIPQETMRAKHWLLAAAAHGHWEALGQLLLDVPGSGEERPKVETRWMKRMEEQGWF